MNHSFRIPSLPVRRFSTCRTHSTWRRRSSGSGSVTGIARFRSPGSGSVTGTARFRSSGSGSVTGTARFKSSGSGSVTGMSITKVNYVL